MPLIFLFFLVFPLIFAVEVRAAGEVLITGNETILGENGTFRMGFFSANGGPNWYLGIWYASLPTATYVWVANREIPVKTVESATVEVGGDGTLKIMEAGGSVVWQTTNEEEATAAKLLESGNLVLLSREKKVVWQSFDFPADTWLPGMNMTANRSITCWKSSVDPSPGLYSLRLKPPDYGEFELVFNGTMTYWTTGNWTGDRFVGVPEMTIPYIYKFHFLNPFTPAAAFWYTVTALESGGGGGRPPLNRFHVDSSGLLRQYTWFSQDDTWNIFWSQPENRCRVYGLCGNFGLCSTMKLQPCECLPGFQPSEELNWSSGDFAGGCRREDDDLCSETTDDEFKGIGSVSFDGAALVTIPGNPKSCEASCLTNCSCVGVFRNARSNSCYNVYGPVLNLKNLSSDSTEEGELLVRVHRGGIGNKNGWKRTVLVAGIVGFSTISMMITMAVLLALRKRRQRKKQVEEEDAFSVTNLKVFSYKELNAATQGFSEKLGHGGFGTVFKGELSDSSQVAVKRLERPGGGEKEFRAEVCTIGNIQHVNLVRFRGFCSENSHRLLVYEYMQNGPLSVFLRRDGENLSWDVRFRVAVGTARGIAYLHEECRDCIIHCDIKPENILLDADFTPKVSDFGLAKLMGRDFSRVLATMRGTWGYVAPEWISGVAITAKADVYSYGMTLLELIGGRRNVETPPSAGGGGGGGGGDEWFFPPWAARQIIEGNVAAVVDERLKDSYNSGEAERVGLVAVWCIQDEEAARPTMGTVVKMLEGVVEVGVPPPPKLLQALVSGESFHGVVAESGGGTSTMAANSHSSHTSDLNNSI